RGVAGLVVGEGEGARFLGADEPRRRNGRRARPEGRAPTQEGTSRQHGRLLEDTDRMVVTRSPTLVLRLRRVNGLAAPPPAGRAAGLCSPGSPVSEWGRFEEDAMPSEPAESPELLERRLATILCADVAGYSRMMGEDEERTVRVFRGHREVFDAL